MIKKLVIPFVLLLLLLAYFAPKMIKDPVRKPLYVVATTSQIGDLVRNIASDGFTVDHIMGSGIDPHLYRPTRSDIAKLMQADIVFYNGISLEGKMEHLLEQVSETKPVIAISSSLKETALLNSVDSQKRDPHIWMDAKNWIAGSKVVASTLFDFTPDNADLINQNKEAYIKKLEILDEYYKDMITTIPKNQRILVTAHDAFGYFGDAYNVDVIGIQGISTESEAGLSKIEDIIDILVSREIKAVFIESSVGEHNVIAIIEGAKARGHNVEIGGSLFSDAMGRIGTSEAEYLGMMVYNIYTITRALGGDPESVTVPEYFEFDKSQVVKTIKKIVAEQDDVDATLKPEISE